MDFILEVLQTESPNTILHQLNAVQDTKIFDIISSYTFRKKITYVWNLIMLSAWQCQVASYQKLRPIVDLTSDLAGAVSNINSISRFFSFSNFISFRITVFITQVIRFQNARRRKL